MSKTIEEYNRSGMIKKGGTNSPPSTPKPSYIPKSQKPNKMEKCCYTCHYYLSDFENCQGENNGEGVCHEYMEVILR